MYIISPHPHFKSMKQWAKNVAHCSTDTPTDLFRALPVFSLVLPFSHRSHQFPFSDFLLPCLPSARPLLVFLCLEWQSFFLWLYVFLPRRQLCCIIIHDEIISVYFFLFVFIPLKYNFLKKFKILLSLSWFNIREIEYFSSGLSHNYVLSSHLSKIIYRHDKCW